MLQSLIDTLRLLCRNEMEERQRIVDDWHMHVWLGSRFVGDVGRLSTAPGALPGLITTGR